MRSTVALFDLLATASLSACGRVVTRQQNAGWTEQGVIGTRLWTRLYPAPGGRVCLFSDSASRATLRCTWGQQNTASPKTKSRNDPGHSCRW